ncbi:MAG: CvpA family protein [Firmicutes bacterium]|nr:CvpA family protein [Bacillota bacterium]
MSLIVDLILLAIIAICVYVGFSKGFVKSFMGLISLGVALFVGVNLTPSFAEYLKKNIFFDKISSNIEAAINKIIGSSVGNIELSSLFKDKPLAFTDLIERYGLIFSDVEEHYAEISSSGAVSSEAATESIAEYIANPVAGVIAQICAFILIFIGALIILKLITFILELLFRLPVLKTANKLLGGVFGIIGGLMYSWIACSILSVLVPALEKLHPTLFSAAVLEGTIVYKFLSSFNILEAMLLVLFK